jgi:hypothetical protein
MGPRPLGAFGNEAYKINLKNYDYKYNSYVGYFVIRLYTTRVKFIITLLSLHVSALLGHHQVANVYNYNIKDIPIQRIRCYIIGVLYYIVTFNLN